MRARRFASRTPKAKTMKKRTTKYPCRRTVRITQAEDEILQRQAAIARISVAEYMRRKFFGGRPIIARTDDLTIRELRRLGGLLKHNFILASESNQKETWHEMNETLGSVGSCNYRENIEKGCFPSKLLTLPMRIKNGNTPHLEETI